MFANIVGKQHNNFGCDTVSRNEAREISEMKKKKKKKKKTMCTCALIFHRNLNFFFSFFLKS